MFPRDSLPHFGDLLKKHVEASRKNIATLSTTTGIPKQTIKSWLSGTVRAPRDESSIIRMASALGLNREEASQLLSSAGHRNMRQLLVAADTDPSLCAQLAYWLDTEEITSSDGPQVVEYIDESVSSGIQIEGKVVISAVGQGARVDARYVSGGDLIIHHHQMTAAEMRYRQVLLQKVRSLWIHGLLANATGHLTPLPLTVQEDATAVSQPWMMAIEHPTGAAQNPSTVTDVYKTLERLGGSMLILGAPGSGKTIMLLQLARVLLDKADVNEGLPIPLILNLSSWGQRRLELSDWLVEELYTTYQIDKAFGREWLVQQPFHLLLDGLDEVEPPHRAACIATINQFCADHGLTNVIVCSRQKEYLMLPEKLALPGAICIQPMRASLIDRYLAIAGSDLANLRQAIQQDETLGELAETPLTFSLMVWLYRNQQPETFVATSLADRRAQLFSAYITRAFAHRKPDDLFPPHQARYWLKWLARKMEQRNESLFYIEHIEIDWLSSRRQQLAYKIAHRVLSSLAGSLPIFLLGLWTAIRFQNWLLGLTIATVPALAGALSGGLTAGTYAGVSGMGIGLMAALFLMQSGDGFVTGFGSSFLIACWMSLLGHLTWRLEAANMSFSDLLFRLGIGAATGITVALLGLWLTAQTGQIDTAFVWSLAPGIILGLSAGLGIGLLLGKQEGRMQPFLRWCRRWLAPHIRHEQVDLKEVTGWGFHRRTVLAMLGGGVLGMLLDGLLYFLFDYPLPGFFGPGLLLLALLLGGSRGTVGYAEKRIQVNEAVWQSFWSGLRWSLIAFVAFLLLDVLVFRDAAYVPGLLIGSAGAILLGAIMGELGFARHFILRLILWRTARMPRQYSQFLDEMAGRVLLYKVGGAYMFIHRLLQSHLGR